ncbi:MAG TPA: hypothetical protein VGU70_00930 [Methylobacterium sp.]|jgi:hypothetical protein|nr:hypothetical protein [Methylobacterium sp.]
MTKPASKNDLHPFEGLRAFTLLLAALFLLPLAGCTADRTYSSGPVGTGWSRAPDLSIYGAMDMAGELARESEIVCRGRKPGAVSRRWQAEFGAREDWIRSALAQRYGAEALAAEERRVPGRSRCTTFDLDDWRSHYADLLRVLELRYYPPGHWETPS